MFSLRGMDRPARSSTGRELQGWVVADPPGFAHLVIAKNYRIICRNTKAVVCMRRLSKGNLRCESGPDPQYLWPSGVVNLVRSVNKLWKSET